MKHQFFYSHLVETSDIKIKLSELDLSGDEKTHLTSLMEANVHSIVIETVLSELSAQDKKTFLKNLISNDHQKIWEHLNSRIGKLEDKIKTAVENLKIEFLKDIVQARNLSQENKS